MSITSSNTYSQEKRANAFPVLVEIGKEFTSRHNTEEEVLRFICEKAGRLMDAKNLVAILQKSDQLNVVLAFQNGQELCQPSSEQFLRLIGRKKVERIIETSKWILFFNKEQVQAQAESPEEHYASLVGVPLCLQNRAIGALVLYHPEQEGLYNEDDANILDAITDLAANEIENIRLVRAEKTKTNALTELHNIGQDLLNIEHSRQDSGTFLRNIAERAQGILQADLIEVFEYLPDIQQYKTPQIVVGEKYHPEMSERKITEADKVVFQKIYEQGPSYIPHSQNYQAFLGQYPEGQSEERFVIREQIFSTAAVPLRIQDEKMGLIFVNYRTPQHFPPEQKQVIELFANQAAMAIKNNRLFQLEQEAHRQAEALKEAARVINESLELPDMAKHIFGQLKNVLEYNSVSLQLIEGDCRKIIGHDGFPFHENYPKKLLKNISEDSLISKIVQSKQPLVLSETEKFPELWTVYDETRHIKSWIGVPLLVQDQVIGLLTIDHKQAGYYTDKSKEIAVAFANIVAPALMNSKLFKQAKTQLEQRINDFNDLRDISQLVNTKELHALFEEILKKSVKFTSADYADVWLYDPQTTTIRLEVDFEQKRTEQIYKKGQRQFNIQEHKSQEHKSIVGCVISEARSYLCLDVKNDPNYWEAESEVRSEIAIPLISQNQVIGVLNFESKKLAAFTEEHQKLLEALAAPAAIAIQNATLYNELNRLSLNRKILVEIEQELSAGINQKQEDILRLIYTQASKLPGMKENFSIVMFDEATKIIEFKLAYQNGANVKLDSPGWEVRELQPKDAQGIGKTDHIIHQKSPLYLSTKMAVKEWGFHETPGFKGYVQGQQAASWLGVPMIAGEKVLGVLATYHYEQEYFYTPEDIELFEALAKQSAIAIEHARLYNELSTANKKQEILITLAQTLTSDIRRKETQISHLIYNNASGLMDTSNMFIAFYDHRTDTVSFDLVYEKGRCVYEHGKGIDEKSSNIYKSRPGGQGKSEWIIRNKTFLFQPTKIDVAGWYRQQGTTDYVQLPDSPSSWVGVPMMFGENVVGVIATYPTKEYYYTIDDLKILQAMANIIAIALDNVRLYKQKENSVTQQGTLIDIGKKLTSEINVQADEIFTLIHQSAKLLMPVENFSIALYDDARDEVRFPFRLHQGERQIIAPRQHRIGKTEEVIRTKKTLKLLNRDAVKTWEQEHEIKRDKNFKIASSWIGVPIKIGDKILGVIATYNLTQEHAYTDDQVELLESLANYVAIALENARLFKDVKEALRQKEEAFEQKEKAERDKEESEKWVYFGRIAGSLAHRIGNKGGMIRLCLEDLNEYFEEKQLTNEFLTKQLDTITRNNQYLLELSQVLFKPIKAVEEGLEKTNVAHCLDDAVRYAAIPEDIKVFSQYEHALPFVYGNKYLVEVFVELISNAAKAMAQSPQKELTITAQYHQEKKRVEIRFSDTGRGIHPEDRSILFELFFKNRSHGFGLWWIKTFLERIQGNIQYEENAQQGATFIIELPVTEK